MQWRVLTALALIGLIVGGGLLCREKVEARCDQVEALLLETRDRLENGVPSVETLEQATALWEEDLPLLSALLHHDRLERVGQELASGLGYLKADDRAGCLSRLHAASYLLDDVREYDDINWKTLF